jgi:hypothetical protein
MALAIRPALDGDAAALGRIYNHYVADTCVTFETGPVAAAEMARRVADTAGDGLPWLVACRAGEVAGYAYASKWKGRCAYRYTAEVTVYLDPVGQRDAADRSVHAAGAEVSIGSCCFRRGDGPHDRSDSSSVTPASFPAQRIHPLPRRITRRIGRREQKRALVKSLTLHRISTMAPTQASGHTLRNALPRGRIVVRAQNMSSIRLLVRDHESHAVPADFWADSLAFALRFGWNPSGPSASYLANGFDVTLDAAASLSEAFDLAFESALRTPHTFYPVPVDMGQLYELNEFIKGGRFEVRDA